MVESQDPGAIQNAWFIFESGSSLFHRSLSPSPLADRGVYCTLAGDATVSSSKARNVAPTLTTVLSARMPPTRLRKTTTRPEDQAHPTGRGVGKAPVRPSISSTRPLKRPYRRRVVDDDDDDDGTDDRPVVDKECLHAVSLVHHRLDQDGAGGTGVFDGNAMASQLRGHLTGARMGVTEKTLAMMMAIEREIRSTLLDGATLVRETEGDELESERTATQALGGARMQLAHDASTRWKPGVFNMLMQCACLRVSKINPVTNPTGAAVPDGSGRSNLHHCVVCGTCERFNEYAIDLSGPAVPEFAFCGGVKEMVASYDAFHSSYVGLYEGFDAPFQEGDDELPIHDMGRLYVGSTCLRKLVIAWRAAHDVNTWMYNAHHEIDRLSRLGKLPEDEYVCATVVAAHRFAEETAALKEAVAADEGALPVVEFDHAFFERLDAKRVSVVSKQEEFKGSAFASMLHRRAKRMIEFVANEGSESLVHLLQQEGDDRDDSDEDGEDGEDGEYSECEEGEGEGVEESDEYDNDDGTSSQGSPLPKRPRVVHDEDSEVECRGDKADNPEGVVAPPPSIEPSNDIVATLDANDNEASALLVVVDASAWRDAAHTSTRLMNLLFEAIEHGGPLDPISLSISAAIVPATSITMTLQAITVGSVKPSPRATSCVVGSGRVALYGLADAYPLAVRASASTSLYKELAQVIRAMEEHIGALAETLPPFPWH